MRNPILVVCALMACVGHGRRVETHARRMLGSSSKALQQPSMTSAAQRSSGKELPLLLNPAAAFSSFGLTADHASGKSNLATSRRVALQDQRRLGQPGVAMKVTSDGLSDAAQQVKSGDELRRGEVSMVATLNKAMDTVTELDLDLVADAEAELSLARKQREQVLLEAQLEEGILKEAYEKCNQITSMASKTFYLGSKLLDDEEKKAMWAIYTWCRRTDDLVDSPLAMIDSDKMARDLSAWQTRLERVWQGEAYDQLDYALLDTIRKYPSLEIEPFHDMVKGMMMDTPQYGQNRYETWDELYVYCYRVASTVGLMTLPIFGTAPGYTQEQARQPAIALGIALQITNILRDVGEDAKRGRIYLPKEDMDRFGVTETQIINGRIDENYIKLMKFEIQRARDYYKEAQEGIPMLAPAARLGVQAAADVYGGILEKLEKNGYDNFDKRAFVTSAEKLGVLLKSWWTVSQMDSAASSASIA